MNDTSASSRVGRWFRLLNPEQRIAAVILCSAGFFALVLSAWHMHAQIWSPFMAPKSMLAQAVKILNAQNQDDDVALKAKDTDHDGLSDYDELSAYGTSPYLADSDSDAVPDPIEIARGTNPHCPEGKECGAGLGPDSVIQVSASSTAFADLLVTQPIRRAPVDALVGQTSSSVSGVQAFLDNPPPPGSMTASQIRQFLVSHSLAGPEQVNALPDAQVIQVYAAAYEEALKVQAASQGAAISESPQGSSTQ